MNRINEGIDTAGVTRWMAEHTPAIVPPLQFTQIEGGRSNLTYLVTDSESQQWVLRRPPLGPLLPSAHDMAREHRILTALAGSSVPVPAVIGLCSDETVTGATFYAMEFVDGLVLRDQDIAEQLPAQVRAAAAEAAIAALADLHDLDPDSIGLGGLSRSEGYVERLIRRWTRQFVACKTRDVLLIEQLAETLLRAVPPQQGVSVVHGDYRLDNIIVSPESGHVRAVLDWEICTLGDPLADVGMLLAYWSEPGDDLVPILSPPTLAPGFPGRPDIAEIYAERSGRDMSEIDYYHALGLWKLACILEGVYARNVSSPPLQSDESWRHFNHMVPELAEQAHDIARRAGLTNRKGDRPAVVRRLEPETAQTTEAGYPGSHALLAPDHDAVIMADTGYRMTYKQLDERSRLVGGLLSEAGLAPGDHLAFMLPNSPAVFEIAWGAQRSGLYYTPIGTRLTVDEAAHIANDCDALALFAAPTAIAADLVDAVPKARTRLVVDGPLPGYEDYDAALRRTRPITPDEEREGARMHYTSGTTGRPKGVLFGLKAGPMGSESAQAEELAKLYSLDRSSVYLSPGPLYHAGPLGYAMALHRIGATVVVLDRFDPIEFLRAIERYRVTHVQCVPTMFVRLLALDEQVRERFDIRSLKRVIHAAAPCPVHIKERIIDWLGPIVDEYYGGTEHFGVVRLTAQQWLAHKGSVGRDDLKRVHVVGDDGEELPAGKVGAVYFENEPLRFSYYKDPEKTARARDKHGWYSYGDIGYLDEERYLYLTDRRDFMIISGGINIYPQEIEDILIEHPGVMDAAVFGMPDPDFGERVVAAIQPKDEVIEPESLRTEIDRYCRSRLAGFKVPRTIRFEAELPRAENGKLYKRQLRERYLADL